MGASYVHALPNVPDTEDIAFSPLDKEFIEALEEVEELHKDTQIFLVVVPIVEIMSASNIVDLYSSLDRMSPDYLSLFTNLDKIYLSSQIKQIQIHITLHKPKPDAKKFFLALKDYYSEILRKL